MTTNSNKAFPATGKPKDATKENENETGKVNDPEEQEYIDDTDPPLTEEDLEENDLTEEDADEVEWDEPENDEED